MMRGMASTLEEHHRVQVLDEALEAAVKLSHRYIPARQLPDKAVSLLDTACARVAISQHAVPAEVEDSRRRIEALETELEIIGRESAVGIGTRHARTASAQELLATERKRLAELEARWKPEKELVDQILAIASTAAGREERSARGRPRREDKVAADRGAGGQGPGSGAGATARSDPGRWRASRATSPLIFSTRGQQAVASVVADWTGIPVGRMVKNEIETVLKLAETLGQRVIGQDHALEMIAKRIQTSRAGLENPNKPIGVFMLAGPSGVGKTETALALAEALYGGEQNLITINMSEFQEAHTVSTLKGAPPGYVGYGEGGVLTEAVRRRPYSVVLLDEVEKAHPDVHEIFFQVFDKGVDGGRRGAAHRLQEHADPADDERRQRADHEHVQGPGAAAGAGGHRQGAARAAAEVVPGGAARPHRRSSRTTRSATTMLGNIVRLQLGRVAKRIAAAHSVPFTYDDAVVKLIASRCTELESGGRMIDAILTNTLLPADQPGDPDAHDGGHGR